MQPVGIQHAGTHELQVVLHVLHELQGEQHTLQPDVQEHTHAEPHGAQVDGTQVLGVHPVGNPPHGVQVGTPQVGTPHTGVQTEGRHVDGVHVDGVHPVGSEPLQVRSGAHGTQGTQGVQGAQKPHMSIQRPHAIPDVTAPMAAPSNALSRLPVFIRVSVPLIKGINSGLPVATAATSRMVFTGSLTAASTTFAAVSATVPTTSTTAEAAEQTAHTIASTTPPISAP